MKVKIFLIVCVLGFTSGQKPTIPIQEIASIAADYFFKNMSFKAASAACQTSIDNVFQNISLSSIKFIDASTKIPTGILDSNFFDLGNYQECMNIHDVFNGEELYGKYCLGTIPVDVTALQPGRSNNNLKMLGQQHIGLHWAYCLPHTCTNEDFNETIFWSDFHDEYCYTKAETHKLDGVDITAIVILSIFLLLVICSTTLDLMLQYQDKKTNHQILLAFSMWTNGKKILQISKNSEQLSCLNGIRAISMVWVIYGHVNSNVMINTGIVNFAEVSEIMSDAKNMYIMSAPVSVDTFFTISGLLVMYLFMKNLNKNVKFTFKKIPMFYLHRYLRLTPALAVLVLFNASLVRYLGSGPFWGTIEDTIKPCRKYWWSTLLYVQNYVNPEEMCAGQTWYLSVDMQLFIVTPVILIAMQKKPKLAVYILSVLILAGIAAPFALTYSMDLKATINSNSEQEMRKYVKYYYYQTYARFGPYVIGMLFGWIIYKLKNNEKRVEQLRKNKWMLALIWIIAIGGLLATTYGVAPVVTEEITDTLSKSFYNGFNRNAWAVSVGIVATMCCLGLGGIINLFLSLPLFQFLSKLSYAMYLVHFTWVISIRLMNSKVLTYFEEINMIQNFWGDFMITLIVSFVFSAVFESPMIIIEKYLFGDNKKKETKQPA